MVNDFVVFLLRTSAIKINFIAFGLSSVQDDMVRSGGHGPLRRICEVQDG